MIEKIYKHVKTGDVYELWTSKRGTPYITKSTEDESVIISFEFKSKEDRKREIDRLIEKGRIKEISQQGDKEC